jgi:general secretion pathway protein D
MNRCAQAQAASRPVFSAAAFRIALFAVFAVVALTSVSLHAESARSVFKHGQLAETKEDYDTAYKDYQKAQAKAPKDLTYRLALARVRVTASGMHMTKGRKLLAAGDEQGALTEFLHASEIDPSNDAAGQEIAKIRKKHDETYTAGETSLPMEPGRQEEIDSIGAPAILKPVSNEPLTLHMTEDTKVIYQAIGRAAGVNILFDPDYSSKRIQVDLNNVSLLDGLRIVGTMSNTYWRPVTDNTIFVAANTRAKHTELDEAAVETFYLTNAWQQNDLNDVQTALRNVLPGAKVYGVASQNAIVMKGTPDELMLAQKLIGDLDKARPEVVVDIAILEVSKNWEQTLGIQWPTSVGVALQAPGTNNSTSSTTSSTTGTNSSTTTSPSLYDLSHLKATDFAVTVGAATANLLLTDDKTTILQNPRIRATDGQKATMKIGEKVPIATGSYQTGAATAVVSSLVNTQFQYTDVGVNIEMTPTIHFDGDVTLKVKIEVSAIASYETISGVTEPIISQRVVDQVIRLREGEASILGGLQNKQESINWSGIPGLSSIPILKYLFGSKDHTINDDELVFLVVPHIVRTQMLDMLNLRTVDTGAGTTVQLRHISSESPSANPQSATPPVHTPINLPRNPAVGTVPGQSAAAAGPAALKQIKAAGDANGVTATADVANHQTAPQPGSPIPPPVPPIPGSNTPKPKPDTPAIPPPPGGVSLTINPLPAPVTAGATFRIPVQINGGTDIAAVPLQIQYDPAKLSLVNVDSGDFLERDGKPVTLIHRDDGPGMININVSRPPGVTGISGAGTVCVLSFQAKTAGASNLVITHPTAMNSAQKQLQASGSQVSIVVK